MHDTTDIQSESNPEEDSRAVLETKTSTADNIDDTEKEELNESVDDPVPFSKKEAMKSITAAVKDGNISAWQAQELKLQLGLSQKSFTGKKINKGKRKHKNKLQARARRISRQRKK